MNKLNGTKHNRICFKNAWLVGEHLQDIEVHLKPNQNIEVPGIWMVSIATPFASNVVEVVLVLQTVKRSWGIY